MADHGWNAIENHIYGFTMQRISSPVAPEDYDLHAMASLIAKEKHSGVNDFEFGLNLILDGLQAMVNRSSIHACNND